MKSGAALWVLKKMHWSCVTEFSHLVEHDTEWGQCTRNKKKNKKNCSTAH